MSAWTSVVVLVLASGGAAVTLGVAAEGLLSEHLGKPPLLKHESVYGYVNPRTFHHLPPPPSPTFHRLPSPSIRYGYVNLVCAAIVCAAATHMIACAVTSVGALSARGDRRYPTA